LIFPIVIAPSMPDLQEPAPRTVRPVETSSPCAQKILKRPEVVDRIRAAQEAMKSAPPTPMPGPNRSQLLELAG
jgi:hypothetical protein